MNTHDIDIELPPLPTPPSLIQRKDWYGAIQAYARSYGMECAHAAIEADRKRRGDPANESQRVYLHDEGFPEYLDGARCQYVIERGKPYPHGDPVAFVYEKEDAERIVAALNNEPRRGEPVYLLAETDGMWSETNEATFLWWKANSPRAARVLYTAPQPAESCASLISDKPVCGSEIENCDPQPAEPDLAKCAECGAEMIHVRPGKWQHPDCPQSPRAAEPVKEVTYCQHPRCLTAAGCSGPCRYGQPAEPVHETARTAGNGAEIGMNTGPQGGAHSASSYSGCGCNSDDCRVNGCLSKRQAQSAMAPGGGGMPAEPVKVPSVDEIMDAVMAYGSAHSNPQTTATERHARLNDVRTLLARYGQHAQPAKSSLSVTYDDKYDCLYVVCDSNEPADAEEDDKGILYRRAISDGRLVGITISNFMGQSRYGGGTP